MLLILLRLREDWHCTFRGVSSFDRLSCRKQELASNRLVRRDIRLGYRALPADRRADKHQHRRGRANPDPVQHHGAVGHLMALHNKAQDRRRAARMAAKTSRAATAASYRSRTAAAAYRRSTAPASYRCPAAAGQDGSAGGPASLVRQRNNGRADAVPADDDESDAADRKASCYDGCDRHLNPFRICRCRRRVECHDERRGRVVQLPDG